MGKTSNISDVLQTYQYSLYTGPDKSDRILQQTGGSALDECRKQCSQKQDCAAVKFNDVTGNGNKEYMLLANPPPCEAADIMATMMYQKYHWSVRQKCFIIYYYYSVLKLAFNYKFSDGRAVVKHSSVMV